MMTLLKVAGALLAWSVLVVLVLAMFGIDKAEDSDA
jgi:hypothetical protein